MDDQEKSINAVESITLTTKQWRTVVVGIISGVILVGGIGSSGVIRFDKFGASDAERLENDILNIVRLEIRSFEQDMREKHYEMEINKPPPSTRARIRALEHCLERNCTDFSTPTTEW